MTEEPGQALLLRLFERVRAASGICLNESKLPLVQSRLAKRMRALNMRSAKDYCRMVLNHGEDGEFESLLDALTTNKTSLFREEAHFRHLGAALPALGRSGHVLKIWSAACSSGEEAYSLGMTALEASQGRFEVKVLGSDLSARMIQRALAPEWDEEQVGAVPQALRASFLSRTGQAWAPAEILRRACSFALLNLNAPEWPLRNAFDAIFCRNVMIYFDREIQSRLVARLIAQLKPGGFFYTGLSENLLGIRHGLKCAGPSIYQRPL